MTPAVKAAGKEASYSTLAPGKVRVLLLGLNQELVPNGEVATVFFSIQAGPCARVATGLPLKRAVGRPGRLESACRKCRWRCEPYGVARGGAGGTSSRTSCGTSCGFGGFNLCGRVCCLVCLRGARARKAKAFPKGLRGTLSRSLVPKLNLGTRGGVEMTRQRWKWMRGTCFAVFAVFCARGGPRRHGDAGRARARPWRHCRPGNRVCQARRKLSARSNLP